ncbi:TIGR03016 family PEP-CTERM system-associated outer membrane protein [Candidatus Berkiella cookevillensis]|uniref:TIGR03016 family PEP-CTERM system-associated outer membrane protein n=1 Tax=Candidatus Berkiella cookevillensis TaxID=437022 RepID=A0AAE3L503_9GAMM|nr:TIGR03016 family PEP-CTERM system-associated outer membrane protein [Candidatus Berkiella cookevillensis]MCS5709142.1 TIGR03016 family PEP-CTERM system-associated outer membrane protein [Candidatus Berkiella cookevillensis]
MGILLLSFISFFSVNTSAYYHLSPEISVSQYYSDNVKLMPRSMKKSEWILEVMPALLLQAESPRSHMDAEYLLQGLGYWNKSHADKIYHRGSLHYERQISRKHMDFSMDGIYTQQVLYPENQAFSGMQSGDNRSDVGSFQLGPDFRYSFGQKIRSDLKIKYGQTHYPSSNLSHVNDWLAEGGAWMGTHVQRLSSSFQYQYRETAQSYDLTLKTLTLNGLMQYEISRRLIALFRVGYEDNQNLRGIQQSLDGYLWYAGFQYFPNKRTQITIQKGHRSFGDSSIVNASWYRKRQSFSLDYGEEITTRARQQIDFSPRGNLNNIVFSPSQFTPTQINQILISKTLDAVYRYNLERVQFSVNAFQNKNIVLASSSEEKGKGVSFSADYEFRRNIHISAKASDVYQRYFNQEQDQRYVMAMGMSWQLARSLSLSGSYQYFLNHSDNYFRKTGENLASIGFRYGG